MVQGKTKFKLGVARQGTIKKIEIETIIYNSSAYIYIILNTLTTN